MLAISRLLQQATVSVSLLCRLFTLVICPCVTTTAGFMLFYLLNYWK